GDDQHQAMTPPEGKADAPQSSLDWWREFEERIADADQALTREQAEAEAAGQPWPPVREPAAAGAEPEPKAEDGPAVEHQDSKPEPQPETEDIKPEPAPTEPTVKAEPVKDEPEPAKPYESPTWLADMTERTRAANEEIADRLSMEVPDEDHEW